MQLNIKLFLDNALFGLDIWRGRQLALAAQPGPEDKEDHRNRNHHGGNAAEECSSPLNPHVLEHLSREKREDRSHGRSHNGVGRKCGCRTGLVH